MDKVAIFKKLYLTDEKKALILNAPDNYKQILTDISYAEQAEGMDYNFVQLFAYSLEELQNLMKVATEVWESDTLLWACYPKGTAKVKSDIKRGSLVTAVEEFGVRPVTQISLDETWTAMRLRPHDRVGK